MYEQQMEDKRLDIQTRKQQIQDRLASQAEMELNQQQEGNLSSGLNQQDFYGGQGPVFGGPQFPGPGQMRGPRPGMDAGPRGGMQHGQRANFQGGSGGGMRGPRPDMTVPTPRGLGPRLDISGPRGPGPRPEISGQRGPGIRPEMAGPKGPGQGRGFRQPFMNQQNREYGEDLSTAGGEDYFQEEEYNEADDMDLDNENEVTDTSIEWGGSGQNFKPAQNQVRPYFGQGPRGQGPRGQFGQAQRGQFGQAQRGQFGQRGQFEQGPRGQFGQGPRGRGQNRPDQGQRPWQTDANTENLDMPDDNDMSEDYNEMSEEYNEDTDSYAQEGDGSSFSQFKGGQRDRGSFNQFNAGERDGSSFNQFNKTGGPGVRAPKPFGRGHDLSGGNPRMLGPRAPGGRGQSFESRGAGPRLRGQTPFQRGPSPQIQPTRGGKSSGPVPLMSLAIRKPPVEDNDQDEASDPTQYLPLNQKKS